MTFGPRPYTLFPMQKILAVDDEPDILALIEYNLKKAGFSVRTTEDGEEALRILRTGSIDLMVLDLMLPGLNGWEVCRAVRRDPDIRHVPIIMLTARGEEEDRVRGLESGADDYLTKPFSPRELVARVRAVLRRPPVAPAGHKVLELGDLAIDTAAFEVRKRGRLLELSATEFRLLAYLAERKGRVFSREQLLDAVWTNEAAVESRTVDVHIRRLRMAIEDDPAEPKYLRTRRGVGYYLGEDGQ